MYIQKKSFASILKAIIGLISLALLWYVLTQFGPNAVRIFPTWILLIAAIYFPTSAIIIALNPRNFNGKIICPMLEGLLLINFLLMSVVAIASAGFHFYLPQLPQWFVWINCLVLPLLIFMDWLLFVKKGAWRPIFPVYWLAPSVGYAATIIFLTQLLPDDVPMRFPLEIFNYLEYGLPTMFGWIFIVLFLTLSAGYLLYFIDFTMSGKLAKKILLPHLQVVEIDENGNEIVPVASTESHETQKLVSNKPSANSIKSSSRPPKSHNQSKQKSPKTTKSYSGDQSASKKSTEPEIIQVTVEKVGNQVRHKTNITSSNRSKKPKTNSSSPRDSKSKKN